MKPWHWISLAFTTLLGVLIVWLLLAYGELPRLWSKHEHKLIGKRDQIVSYTSQDIPADPINLHIVGSRESITCAFLNAALRCGVTSRSISHSLSVKSIPSRYML